MSSQLSLVDDFGGVDEHITHVREAPVSSSKRNVSGVEGWTVLAMKKRVREANKLAVDMVKRCVHVENARDLQKAVDLWQKGIRCGNGRKKSGIDAYLPFSTGLFKSINSWFLRNERYCS